MINEKLEIMLKKAKLDKEYENKLERGVRLVLQSYYYSKQYPVLVIDDVWEKDAEDIITCMKVCGIEKFAFNDTSTEATKVLKVFVKNGALIRKTIQIADIGEALLLEL